MAYKFVILCALFGVALAAPQFILPYNSYYYEDPSGQVILLRARRSPQLALDDMPIPDAAPIPQEEATVEENMDAIENIEQTDLVGTPATPPARIPKVKRPVDDDEDDSPATGLFGRRGYNAFFPITIPGSQAGGALAVANSFSVGKGAATSHATAYGYPQEQKKQ